MKNSEREDLKAEIACLITIATHKFCPEMTLDNRIFFRVFIHLHLGRLELLDEYKEGLTRLLQDTIAATDIEDLLLDKDLLSRYTDDSF